MDVPGLGLKTTVCLTGSEAQRKKAQELIAGLITDPKPEPLQLKDELRYLGVLIDPETAAAASSGIGRGHLY